MKYILIFILFGGPTAICFGQHEKETDPYSEQSDTLQFSNSYCYHEIESCHTIFIDPTGEEVDFQGAFYELGGFADEDWKTGALKEEYKSKKFIIKYKKVDINSESSYNFENYSVNQIMSINLID
tara:strand:- start:479 stop:853 length:375 start_codon:yes stop_codon:yes gene_type:complete